MCPERLRPSGRARAGHMGDDGAGVLLEMVPSATPPHARNAPSSRPKGDGDKRKALPYAQLLSRVREDERSAGGLSAALLLNLEAVILAELTTTLPCWTRLDSAVRPRAAASTASGRVGREFETDICAALERPRERDVSSPRACAISGRCGSLRASVSTIARRTRARRYRFVGRRGHPGARALQCAPSPVGRLTS
jgi:hypothetical protein